MVTDLKTDKNILAEVLFDMSGVIMLLFPTLVTNSRDRWPRKQWSLNPSSIFRALSLSRRKKK